VVLNIPLLFVLYLHKRSAIPVTEPAFAYNLPFCLWHNFLFNRSEINVASWFLAALA
jgi:hypothetical protein